MLYEAPLVAFTVLAQTAVGAHLTVNAFEKFGKPPRVTEPRMNIARFAILVVMGLGFLFSTTHLGSPLRAFNALNRVGSAALSNEILTGASFLSLAGLYWLLTILKIGSEGVRKIVNWLSIAVGVIFMFAMANVYQIETVPAWYSPMTTVAFWFTVVTSGLMFGYTLINVLDVTAEKTNRRLMWAGVSLIALNLAFTVMQTIHFAGISTAIHMCCCLWLRRVFGYSLSCLPQKVVRRTCWLSWHSLPCSLQRFWVVMCSTVCTLHLVCTNNRDLC